MEVFKIPCNILGNLKISCDITNSRVVLWSKYQVFVYDNLNFTNYSKKIEPQFEIQELIVIKDCLVCLDCSGNVNVNTIETFSIWKQNIICICACESINTQAVLVTSLQFEQKRAKLYVNEFDIQNDSPTESFVLEILMPNEDWVCPGESSIMACSHIKSEYLSKLKNIFNIEKSDLNNFLVILSLDKRNVYALLVQRENKPNSPNLWVKLYKSCMDIIDVKITMTDEICILVGLAGGSIIRIPLWLKKQTTEVYHVNSTIHKFEMMGNSIIFTDGLKMWKNDDIFSKADCTFEQFVLKNVRDFCLINNQAISITFSNLIYIFNINNRASYSTTFHSDYICEAKLVTNSDYVQKIMGIVHKNDELLKQINKESEYLMALSLSHRQDIMNELIQVNVSVFDDYRELTSNYTNLTLTDDYNKYYNSDSYYFLVNVCVKRVQHKLNKLLSDVLGDIKIHITLFTQAFLKTTSIRIKEQLTTTNFVISLRKKNRIIRKMQMHFKIITNIPGKFDENLKLCTILYQKCIDFNAENFINKKPKPSIYRLKENDTPLEMQIFKIAKNLHGLLYKLQIPESHKWTLFVKLPNMTNLSIENIIGLIDPVHCKKPYISFKHLLQYSRDKNYLELEIGNEVVRLDIDGKYLKVTCPDIITALDIRNFFSNVIFTYKRDPSNELVDHRYYTVIENLKKEIYNCLTQRRSTNDFAVLLTRFLSYVYCWTPL